MPELSNKLKALIERRDCLSAWEILKSGELKTLKLESLKTVLSWSLDSGWPLLGLHMSRLCLKGARADLEVKYKQAQCYLKLQSCEKAVAILENFYFYGALVRIDCTLARLCLVI